MRKTPPTTDGFEAGSRPQAKECKQPLETEEGREMDFLRASKKERSPVDTLAQGEPHQTYDLQNYKIIYLCFTLLNSVQKACTTLIPKPVKALQEKKIQANIPYEHGCKKRSIKYLHT